MRRVVLCSALALVMAVSSSSALRAQAVQQIEFKVLATSKTGTMEKELNQWASQGFRFATVMGGETAFGGKEVVTVMQRGAVHEARYEYKLLATKKTSTMEKELQAASDGGFDYKGQTVFDSTFGGKEVSCILERDLNNRAPLAYTYKLLATSKTGTMQKELSAVGDQGFEALGMTVGKTSFGGDEIVVITRKRTR